MRFHQKVSFLLLGIGLFVALPASPQSPKPESAKKSLDQVQVLVLLTAEGSSHLVALQIKDSGINFEVKDDYLQELRAGGGDDELITALKSARATKPAAVDPGVQAHLSELHQHVARGAEFYQQEKYPDAEEEYRAAVLLDPQNAALHVALWVALNQLNKSDEALAEAREALRLDPESDLAHFSLGTTLLHQGNDDGAIKEFRAALKLDPDSVGAHTNLGIALGDKGDWKGEIAECQEALRVNPNVAKPHYALGTALAHAGNSEGAVLEYLEALRLNPRYALAHFAFGMALRKRPTLSPPLRSTGKLFN